jgi:hypothetical protein
MRIFTRFGTVPDHTYPAPRAKGFFLYTSSYMTLLLLSTRDSSIQNFSTYWSYLDLIFKLTESRVSGFPVSRTARIFDGEPLIAANQRE